MAKVKKGEGGEQSEGVTGGVRMDDIVGVVEKRVRHPAVDSEAFLGELLRIPIVELEWKPHER